jgi:glucose-1-phosphate thymidylyltransferase
VPEQPIAVILTGGRATRLRPLSHELPKALVPVMNRPLIAYALDRLSETGIEEVFVVVMPGDDRTEIAARESAPAGMQISVHVQAEPQGPGHALAQVPHKHLRDRHVSVIAADALLHGGDLRGHFDSWVDEAVDAWLPLAPTPTPHTMGIAQLEGERITEFIEKPENPKGNLASPAWWLLGPAAVHRILDNPIINARGELEISGTLTAMIDEGHHVGGRLFTGEWLDTGTIAALLAAQARLFEDMDESVLVAPDAIVDGCDLGPNVVVGAGCRLRNVKLSNALVAPGATLENFEGDHVIVTPSGQIGRPAD